MQPVVYILASRPGGTLYVGVTGNLVARAWHHRTGRGSLFCRHYNVRRLVYFEAHGDMYAAITREKQIKRWRRAWKVRLIEQANPAWIDLWPSLTR